jgi:hypothetical protein
VLPEVQALHQAAGSEEKGDGKSMNKTQALLVTTAHKGVFFGYGITTDKPTIRLSDAKMAVYWSADVHGVLGLAVKGPSAGCRIGPAVPSIILRDVTSITLVTKEAEEQWTKNIWS